MPARADLTQLLHEWRAGDRAAHDRLVAALYGQLERIARARLAGERPDHTLNTGALVHEAWIELVDIDTVDWQDRAHFLAIAARVMRRVLVDHAVRRGRQKRGGGRRQVPLDETHLVTDQRLDTLVELDDVLHRLERAHPRQARVVELYYLGGLSQQEVAEVIGISQPTVVRDLDFARAWLARAWNGDVTAWRETSDMEPGATGGG